MHKTLQASAVNMTNTVRWCITYRNGCGRECFITGVMTAPLSSHTRFSARFAAGCDLGETKMASNHELSLLFL